MPTSNNFVGCGLRLGSDKIIRSRTLKVREYRLDHPLLKEENSELRKRVVQLIKSGYSVNRQSNIIFVCGGSKSTDMRKKFQKEFSSLLPDYDFFEPEFAMKSYFNSGDDRPFDITDFEELIANLSHSIVLFPEAPGSFAELGYFSAIEAIGKKTLLAIDSNMQKNDSFISLGPARKINGLSVFHPNIQIDYKKPDFSLISTRLIERSPLSKTLKSLDFDVFRKMSNFELFALTYEIVSLLKIATNDDIEFLLRSLFGSHIAASRSKQIVSTLVGSGRLKEVGDYGHLRTGISKRPVVRIKEGFVTKRKVLNLEISQIFLTADPEFVSILGASAC